MWGQLEHALFHTKTTKAIQCPKPHSFLVNVCFITRDVSADVSVASERKTIGEQKIVSLAIVQAIGNAPHIVHNQTQLQKEWEMGS